MSLDTDAIKQELAALSSQRQEVNERIRSLAPLRGRGRGFRGRGFPGPPGLGPPGRRDFTDREGFASRPFDPLDGPPNPLDRQPPRRPFLARGPPDPEPGFQRMQPPPQPPTRKKLLSAVVVDGEARTAQECHVQQGDGSFQTDIYNAQPHHDGSDGRGGGIVGKRPAEGELLEDNPALKKRNRRLFGALLGTLQKFKDEESAGSDLTQRRAELLQRAEAKKVEEARRLRQEERQEMQNRRMEEIHRKREINLLSDIKRLELIYAEKLARHDRLSAFLKTATGPPVYWTPREHNHLTLKLAEQQRQELQQWKAQQMEQLEVEKREMRERFEKAASRGEPLGAEEGQEGEGAAAQNGDGDKLEGAAAGEGETEGQQPMDADDRYAAAGHSEGLEEGEPGEGKEDHAKEVINAEVSQGLADEKAGEAGTGEKKEEQEAAEEEEGRTAMQD